MLVIGWIKVVDIVEVLGVLMRNCRCWREDGWWWWHMQGDWGDTWHIQDINIRDQGKKTTMEICVAIGFK